MIPRTHLTTSWIAQPLGKNSLDDLLNSIGSARYVLLGEASHGTREYYTWRTEISKRLINEKGFSFVAVEGDWPDCYQVNRYVKNFHNSGTSAEAVLRNFNRWPTWMWANKEIVELVEWLHEHNGYLPEEKKVGFYGLDLYSLWDSLNVVGSYLEKTDTETAVAARNAFACFEPFGPDFTTYAWANLVGYQTCEQEILRVLTDLRKAMPTYEEDGNETEFNLKQNAIITQNAEEYYRIMIKSDRSSWNLRDSHMNDTLERLMNFYGPEARGIVWAHNTHVGDARATDMALDGTINIGQLVRENHGLEDVFIVGFGSYRGSVVAARGWGASMEMMQMPAARPRSLEEVLHRTLGKDSLLMLRSVSQEHELWRQVKHRAVGVVYQPEAEQGNYVLTVLPQRYDAFIYLDQTEAVKPLHLPVSKEVELPETYPAGV